MRKKFNRRQTLDVTLTNGAEDVVLTLQALPAGYSTFIGQAFPRPERYINGRKQPLSPKDETRYLHRQNLIWLAKGLGDELETAAPNGAATPGDWARYADAVEAELQAAELSDGHVLTLLKALVSLSGPVDLSGAEDAAGN